MAARHVTFKVSKKSLKFNKIHKNINEFLKMTTISRLTLKFLRKSKNNNHVKCLKKLEMATIRVIIKFLENLKNPPNGGKSSDFKILEKITKCQVT